MGSNHPLTKSSKPKFQIDPYDRIILLELCGGSTTSAIAEKLGRSQATVNRRRASICDRADISQPELQAWAMQQRPEAFGLGGWCIPGMHSKRCQCDSAYCTSRRLREVA